MSDEDVRQLYDDIAVYDKIACDCHVNALVTVGESDELLYAVVRYAYLDTYCDAPENASYTACLEWCNTQGPDIDNMIGRYHRAYVRPLETHTRVLMHYWRGSEYANIDYSGCNIPEDAECDWARMGEGITNGSRTYGVSFRQYCR